MIEKKQDQTEKLWGTIKDEVAVSIKTNEWAATHKESKGCSDRIFK